MVDLVQVQFFEAREIARRQNRFGHLTDNNSFINKNDASPDFTDDEASSGIYVMSPDGSNLSRILGIAGAKYTGSVGIET